MRLGFGDVLCVAVGMLAAAACGSSGDGNERACVPGASQSCAGPLGCDGYQVCNEEGSAFEPCMCGAGGGGGTAGSGGSGGSGGASGGGNGGTSTNGGAGGSDNNGGTGPDATAGPVTSATSSGGTDATTGGGSGGEGGTDTTTGGSGGADGTTTTGGGTGGTGNDCSVEPTVMLLIDRSTSMWDNQFWEPVREAVLGAVDELDGEVRLGFATFTGQGSTCPLDLQMVDIGLERYEDIAEFYSAIAHPGFATHGPTAAAVYQVSQSLLGSAGSSRSAIVLVTDSAGDFCDSGDRKCRADITVRVLQDAAAAGIPTLVAALPDPSFEEAWMTAMANAGQGEPVSLPSDTQFCDAITEPTASFLQGIDSSTRPSGTYGDTMGPVGPIALDPSDIDGMTALLVDAISDWASCE